MNYTVSDKLQWNAHEHLLKLRMSVDTSLPDLPYLNYSFNTSPWGLLKRFRFTLP